MLNRTTGLRAGLALAVAVVVIGSAAVPAGAVTNAPEGGGQVSIVSSQSNLVAAGAQIPMERSEVGTRANDKPPAGYRLYENHFKSKQTCENRGRWLRDVGKNIDNYWCTPKAQSNGRFWLYVTGHCNTDRVANGNTVIKPLRESGRVGEAVASS